MRLINTSTLELREFFGDQIPKHYAILSHRWESDEVTFQDWENIRLAREKAGFSKIEQACRQARLHDLHYLWVSSAFWEARGTKC